MFNGIAQKLHKCTNFNAQWAPLTAKKKEKKRWKTKLRDRSGKQKN